MTVIGYILKNEKYIGDALLQKKYTTDTLPFTKKINRGERPQYYVEESHEPIIPKEKYYRVQELLQWRNRNMQEQKERIRQPLSGKLKCAECDTPFLRKPLKNQIAWVCKKHNLDARDCPVPNVKEDEVYEAFITMYNRLKKRKGEILYPMLKYMEQAYTMGEDIPQETALLNSRIAEAAKKLARLNGLAEKGVLSDALLAKNRAPLEREKYMGDALSQKTFIADVLEKKPQKNTGQLPQYYVTDNHEAIIPREMFKRVQFERARRSSLEPKGTKTKTNAGRFRPQYVLTEILLCGECGEHYRRCTWARNGKKKVVWRCINRLENGKRNCRESPTLDEGVLHDAILGFLRNLQSPRDELVQNLLEYTEEALEQKTGDSKKQKLLDMLEQKNRLLQEMLSLDIVPDEKIEQLSREYDEIQEQIDSLGDVQNGMEQENAYIRGIKEYMETADFNRYEFDDKLIRQVIEQVIVKNADTLYIRMKGGYEAEIKLPNV